MAKNVQKARTSNGVDTNGTNGHSASNGFDDSTTTAITTTTTSAVSGAEIDLMRPKRSKLRLLLPLLLVIAIVAVVAWWLLTPAKGPTTVSVTRGTIISTVETTGKLQAETSAQLSFKPAGRVDKVLVKQGDTVQKGDVLAELETSDLARNVQQAEVQLEISKLKYTQAQQGAREEDIVGATADLSAATARLNDVKAGSRAEDIAVAQAGVNQAQAKLDTVKKGATADDIAIAEATLRQAQARLDQAKQPATPEQIAGAEAAVREAQAKYDSVNKGATTEDIAVAQAAVDQANASLDKAKKGSTPEDIAVAQAAVDQANANLTKTKKGPTAEDITAAQAKLDEAKAARDGVATSTSNAKEQARLNVVQASNSLQNVQDVYGKIKDENDQKKPADVTEDDRSREAKALRDVKDAEAVVEQANLSYDAAKANEISQLAQADANITAAQATLDKAKAGPSAEDIAIAQSGVDSAKARLDAVKAGPTAEDIAIAQSGVDAAKAKLDAVKAGPKAEDIAAAQAGIDQAQSNLDHLKAGGTASEIAAAQGDVDKAQSSLNKLKAGATPEDIKVAQEELVQAQASLDKVKAGASPEEIQQAQAQVDAAQASLDKLKAGPTSTDLAILEKSIVLSQISVDGANADLDNARLITPIGGTVLTINLDVGETVGGYQQVATVADVNSLRVKADIDELDIGRVSVGQAVTVTLDAYPGIKLSGAIEKLAPGATQKQGSTVYQATINFAKAEGVTPREGMAASVDVTAQRKDNVLLLPNRAIETVGDREYVTIQEGTVTRKIEIEAGLSNNTDTEILSGLTEGQAVVVR